MAAANNLPVMETTADACGGMIKKVNKVLRTTAPAQ
jgi:hypothetical protein